MGLLTCKRCGEECERTARAQRYCQPCSDTVKREAQAERNASKAVKNGRLGEPFCCDRCSAQVIRTHGNQKRCDDCKKLAKAEKKKASRPPPKGHRSPNKAWIIVCCDCGLECERGVNALRCIECAEAHGKISRAKWRAVNDNKLKEDKRRYHEENAELVRQRTKEWRIANPERRREQAARRRQDPRYRLRYAISNGIRTSLLGNKKGRSWEKLVGYTVDDLMRHLERQFLKGMTWENYGPVWHVDHIVADADFAYETPECPDFKAAWALANLRPLWANDNLKKNARRLFLI